MVGCLPKLSVIIGGRAGFAGGAATIALAGIPVTTATTIGETQTRRLIASLMPPESCEGFFDASAAPSNGGAGRCPADHVPASSRSTRRSSLPAPLMGSAWRNSTAHGTL
jgi:hypothetical protein